MVRGLEAKTESTPVLAMYSGKNGLDLYSLNFSQIPFHIVPTSKNDAGYHININSFWSGRVGSHIHMLAGFDDPNLKNLYHILQQDHNLLR